MATERMRTLPTLHARIATIHQSLHWQTCLHEPGAKPQLQPTGKKYKYTQIASHVKAQFMQ